MHTCGYCGTPLQENYCSFCDLILRPYQRMQNGERIAVRTNTFVMDTVNTKSTLELMKCSTYELLHYLRFIRASRSESYRSMKELRELVKKLLQHPEAKPDTTKLDQLFTESGNAYEHMTRKMFVVENILHERLGYIPRKVTDQLLAEYLRRVQESGKGRMEVRG